MNFFISGKTAAIHSSGSEISSLAAAKVRFQDNGNDNVNDNVNDIDQSVSNTDIVSTDSYLHPYEIHKLGHTLRQEQAPFTGEYISYCWDLVEEDKFMQTCYLCRKNGENDSDYITDDEKVQNWKLQTEDNQYVVKVKLWNRT